MEKQALILAFRKTLPVLVSYIPVAILFGLTAGELGLSFWWAEVMTASIFVMSTQIMILGLLATQADPWTAIGAGLVLNSRLLLLSATLSRHLKSWPTLSRLFFSLQILDEPFAIQTADLESGRDLPKAYYLGINIFCFLASSVGTAIGFSFQGNMPDISSLGLDFLTCALFIALIADQLLSWRKVIVALGVMVLMGLFVHMGFGLEAIAIGALAGALLSLGVESWEPKMNSSWLLSSLGSLR